MGKSYIDAPEAVAPARHVAAGGIALHGRTTGVVAGDARASPAGKRVAEHRAAGVRRASEERASAFPIAGRQPTVAGFEAETAERCPHLEVDTARRAVNDVGVLVHRRF